jgi:hypothetical protein
MGKLLPFGEWLPDGPQFQNPGTTNILNCIPRSPASYASFPGPVATAAGALPAKVCGSYGYRGPDGTVYGFAGTQARLYGQKTGAIAWADISGPAAPYHTENPPDGFWASTSFGKRILFSNYVDPIQTYLAGTDTAFSNLSANAPRARFMCVIGDFLLVGNTVDVYDGAVQYRIHWPAIGDPSNWPVPGSNTAISLQSDFQDLQETDLGAITGLVGGHLSSADGCAVMERGIYRIQYAGSPFTFDFHVAEGAAGSDASLSIVQRRLPDGSGVVRSIVYYLASDGFYAFDGSSSTPIGAQKVDKAFYEDLDPSFIRAVHGTYDPQRKLILWFYHGTGNNGLFNKALIFSWELNRWAPIDLSATPVEWVANTTYTTAGYTLDQLDPFGTLDTLPYSLDSRYWTNGNPILTWFDGTHNQVMAAGNSLPATVETTEQQLFPNNRARIRGVRPIHNASVAASVAVGHRERVRSAVIYEGAVPENILGNCPQRSTGRYTRFRMTLPAAANFTHLQGVDLDAVPEGIR